MKYIATSINLIDFKSVTIGTVESNKIVCHMNCIDNDFEEMKVLANTIVENLNKQ